MNSMEEQLWAYIDEMCTADERAAIGKLITENNTWREKYNELLQLNKEIARMELDEPPMAFTYNVMEGIRAEYAKQPLKTAINMSVVKLIGGFFVSTLVLMLVLAFASIDWASANGATIVKGISNQLPNFTALFSGPVFKGFLFIDMILALFLADGYLRRRRVAKEA